MQEGRGRRANRTVHPGSKASSSGLKQALDSSRKDRRALPPFLVPKRVDRDRSGAIGERWVALALVKRGQDLRTCSTVWWVIPQPGQLVRLRGWKRAVYEPTNAWPVIRRTSVAEACLDPPFAP